ncbi:MAG: GNAT family N-acetyltransferase [Kiritimatiellaeota bacterium]|nr:GNAT family N-acetyltransferase [Kiritimatiellota bacterium]
MTSEPCQFLQWDTDFFGFRIARAAVPALDSRIIKEIYNWCANQRIACLYFIAGAEDRQTIRQAESNGFRLVEIRLNVERSLRDWNPDTRPRTAADVLIRGAKPADVPICQDIARTSYVDSRYYFDEHFSEEKCQAYYATWVKKSLEGGVELALVAEKNNEVVGYITGVLSKDKPEARYELTGVRETARKTGVGQELFRAGLDWFVRHNIEHVWLATQGRNVPTQRMVQRSGFITRSCLLYYHKWFGE